MKFHLCVFLLLPLFVSCVYNREEGCHLDKLNIKGNVTKIETIVQSTIPLTELYYCSLDPSESISMLGGNFVYDFDNYGDLKKVIGYGIDGNVLLVTDNFNQTQEPYSAPTIIGVSAKQAISRVENVHGSDGNVVNAKYYSGNELIWNQIVTYNDNGDVASIIKEYSSLSIKSDLLNIQYTDTTTYQYSSFDKHGNWTIAIVQYAGVLPKHQHEYKVIRQITYDGEPEKRPLIEQLKYINANAEHSRDITFDNISIGHYGYIKVPHYMALQDKSYISSIADYVQPTATLDYLFMSVYDNKDAYATMSISRNYVGKDNKFNNLSAEELSYSKELDDELRELNVSIMEQGGTYVLKWLPYCFMDISGKRALKLSYYRHGNGSPIPVYCENYIIPMGDGYTLSVIYSYQSNLENKFRKDFSRVINSIVFN